MATKFLDGKVKKANRRRKVQYSQDTRASSVNRYNVRDLPKDHPLRIKYGEENSHA
ncbi:hypothetical protein [Mechercharimyces sp. CAU 1602]|uniref:hypothetical protein n=1 Tax=Mechercharimyces sp. CAU 1602 TaxID=2973933 RepID=UPI0021625F64|nr:hypothetical protein [Mechercharimyces sp. CAU 1602]MCS1350367.1 hypothetical protein [Mechercharimyces sp. CAU 1602]